MGFRNIVYLDKMYNIYIFLEMLYYYQKKRLLVQTCQNIFQTTLPGFLIDKKLSKASKKDAKSASFTT